MIQTGFDSTNYSLKSNQARFKWGYTSLKAIVYVSMYLFIYCELTNESIKFGSNVSVRPESRFNQNCDLFNVFWTLVASLTASPTCFVQTYVKIWWSTIYRYQLWAFSLWCFTDLHSDLPFIPVYYPHRLHHWTHNLFVDVSIPGDYNNG